MSPANLGCGRGRRVLPGAKVARLLADLRNLGVDENGARRKAVVFSAHLSAIRHVETILQREGALPLFSLASNCDAAR